MDLVRSYQARSGADLETDNLRITDRVHETVNPDPQESDQDESAPTQHDSQGSQKSSNEKEG